MTENKPDEDINTKLQRQEAILKLQKEIKILEKRTQRDSAEKEIRPLRTASGEKAKIVGGSKMKRAKIIVREKIIGTTDDIGLRALNGYYESPFMDFPDNTDDETAIDILQNKYRKHFSAMKIDTVKLAWEEPSDTEKVKNLQ